MLRWIANPTEIAALYITLWIDAQHAWMQCHKRRLSQTIILLLFLSTCMIQNSFLLKRHGQVL